jgi:hypothetical protein
MTDSLNGTFFQQISSAECWQPVSLGSMFASLTQCIVVDLAKPLDS